MGNFMGGMKSFLTIVAVVIIIGLVLRYGNSAIGLTKAFGGAAYQETTLLTLANTNNANYPYHGPG